MANCLRRQHVDQNCQKKIIDQGYSWWWSRKICLVFYPPIGEKLSCDCLRQDTCHFTRHSILLFGLKLWVWVSTEQQTDFGNAIMSLFCHLNMTKFVFFFMCLMGVGGVRGGYNDTIITVGILIKSLHF